MGDRMPHELSGGQQQRVALARALAPQPAVLLLDEPFSNLDAALRVEVRKEVKDLLKRSGTTAVFVTHDQEEALFLGDEIAVMNNGRLEQVGPAEIVFHHPQTRLSPSLSGKLILSRDRHRSGDRDSLGNIAPFSFSFSWYRGGCGCTPR